MAFIIHKAFTDIAAGSKDAYDFMASFYQWVHSLDDLIDKDLSVPLEQSIEKELNFIITVSSNPFFLEHRQKYYPLLLTGALAYLESERFKRHPSVLERIGSQVLKSQYQEVYFMTAYLTGGWRHMVEMSRLYREFDFDDCTPESSAS